MAIEPAPAQSERPGAAAASVIGPSNQTLTYMLVWESLAERETKWNAFAADPEWLAKRAETEADGPIVSFLSNEFLVPTKFSSVQ